MSALRARGISVAVNGREIVRDVSIDVAAGAGVAVLGPSGAGKSTLFGALAGARSARGTVLLGGADVSDRVLHERAAMGLGWVPQEPSVLWDLTARENLATLGRLRGVEVDPAAALAEVGLGGAADTRASRLSGGERRRLELARAFAMRPRVLLLDEPFSGLGPRDVQAVADVLLARRREGLALVVSDHHAEAALSLADRAMLLVDGAVAWEASADRFADEEAVRRRYLL